MTVQPSEWTQSSLAWWRRERGGRGWEEDGREEGGGTGREGERGMEEGYKFSSTYRLNRSSTPGSNYTMFSSGV